MATTRTSKKTSTKKAAPKTSTKKVVVPVSAAEAIFRIAEKHGINCVDVLRFPNVAKETGLSEKELTRTNALQGEAIRREKMAEIQGMIKAHNKRVMEESAEVVQIPQEAVRESGKKEKPSKVQQPSVSEPGKRQTLEGFALTAVLRTLGRDGWKFDEAKVALKALGLTPADGTIRAQLLAGRQGTRGEPANLSKATILKLEKARKAS